MMASMLFLQQPTFRFSLYRPKNTSLSSCLLLRLSASKSSFFGCEKIVFSKSMTELVKVSSFRGRNGDESVHVLEEETSFLDGSNQFQTRFFCDGFETTLNRLSKWLIAGVFGAALLWRHDGEAVWAAMGSVMNSVLSITLKRILNQERPVSTGRSDPGMPSSHAQSIFFIVTFLILSAVEWLGINEFSLIFGAIVLSFGSYFSWLRVSQQLHTVSQVVVGAAVGGVFSFLWYWLWKAFVLEAFDSYLSVRITVILGAASFCLAFLLYVIRFWLNDDER